MWAYFSCNAFLLCRSSTLSICRNFASTLFIWSLNQMWLIGPALLFTQQLERGSTRIPTDSSVIATRPLKTHPCCLCLSQTVFSVFVLLTLARCLPLMWNKGANKSWHTCAFLLFLTPAPASWSRGIFSHYVWSVCHTLCVSMIIILCVWGVPLHRQEVLFCRYNPSESRSSHLRAPGERKQHSYEEYLELNKVWETKQNKNKEIRSNMWGKGGEKKKSIGSRSKSIKY